ncbi:hypothetical protein R5R35_009907 [Gryllus longicercus]|uniref:DUF4200 domain-containing protein n=1 Tax=Gryllus longicercus TaxID=2509291 RepID=A0AAN9VXW5_9ORTH
MPINIKLTKDLTKREVPDCTPEKGVTEYFLSKCEDRYEKKKPEWDVARFSPATELIAKQRELEAVLDRVSLKREEQKNHREELDQRWEELREEENQLRQSFMKFNKFVKENQEKRERAVRKVKEEEYVQAKRSADIRSLKTQLEYLNQVKEKMLKHVQEYKIYEDFLENVAAESNEFQSVYDIVTKYEILIDTRSLLAARQVQDMEEMEEVRNALTHHDEEKEQVLMGINNEMAELQTKYDEAKQNSLRWETILGRLKIVSAEKSQELAQVKTCCWNLFQQLRNSRPNVADKKQEDVEGQLVEIKDAIRALKRVVETAQERTALETETGIAQVEGSNKSDESQYKDDRSRKILEFSTAKRKTLKSHISTIKKENNSPNVSVLSKLNM